MLDAKGLEAAFNAFLDAQVSGLDAVEAAITAYLQAVGPEPAVAVKWEQLSEIINAAVKVAIRTGSDFHVNADKLREFARSALVATPPVPLPHQATTEDASAFKNFHRLLCERFGYTHDEKDWRRDQVSLIEWIARRATPPAERVREAPQPANSVRKAAERVVWFDWSSNDQDAVAAVDALRAALATKPAVKDDETVVEALIGLCDWIENEVGAELPFDARAALAGSGSGWRGIYRLLETTDTIQAGDEVIDDDGVTWCPVDRWSIGCEVSRLFKSIRRALPAAPQQGGE